MIKNCAHPSSFRDPAGYITEIDGEIYRAIHPKAQETFVGYLESGLHEELVTAGLLVPHEDMGCCLDVAPLGWQVLKVKRIPVISYASEWCHSQLQDAALLTLEIQNRALRRGWSLKDANTFNVQFDGTRPVFIDTLSFEPSQGSAHWVAYRQFCEHFLAPLALLKHSPEQISALWNSQVNGVPISLASALLPVSTWFDVGILLHLHLHSRIAAKSPAKNSDQSADVSTRDFSLRLNESLMSAVRSLTPAQRDSMWSVYRKKNTYTDNDNELKLRFLDECVDSIDVSSVLDLGANDGLYSEHLLNKSLRCIAVEADHACCELIYLKSKANYKNSDLLTLKIDLSNPTPDFGWGNRERSSFGERVKSELVLALALLHHLSIGKHIPYEKVADFLCELGEYLIVEYVPPDDPMSLALLKSRHGVTNYLEEMLSLPSFERAFKEKFDVLKSVGGISGGRVIYLMKRSAP